jgi:hypothetical protein
MGSKSNILTKFGLNWLGMGSKIQSKLCKNVTFTAHTKPIQSKLGKNVTFTAHTKPIQSKLGKNVTFIPSLD